MKAVTVKAGAWIEKQLWRDGKISSIVVSKISIHGGGRKRSEETGVNHVPVSLRPVALEVAFDDLSVDRNVIEHRDGALWSDYKYREEKAKEENKNKWTGRKRRSDEIEKDTPWWRRMPCQWSSAANSDPMRGLWVCLGTHAAPSAKNRKRFLLVLVITTINGSETTNVRLLDGARVLRVD